MSEAGMPAKPWTKPRLPGMDFDEVALRRIEEYKKKRAGQKQAVEEKGVDNKIELNPDDGLKESKKKI